MTKLNTIQVSEKNHILIKNATQNNLQIDYLTIPHQRLVVITGVSGSGKSSLAFDTLYAEGQRRYIESLSAYIRQFLGKIEKPEVDYIKGLSPAIAIGQKVNTHNPRSTVGTTTEIYDYLKLLFARIGITCSPISGKEVIKHDVKEVIAFLSDFEESTRAQILAPLKKPDDRTWEKELSILVQKGFNRLYVNQKVLRIEDVLAFFKKEADLDTGVSKVFEESKSIIESGFLLIDRIQVSDDEDNIARISDSVQTAYYEADGACVVEVIPKDGQHILEVFSNRFEADGMEFEEPTVSFFTFNSPHGACPECEGFGKCIGFDEDKVIPDKNLSVYEEAVACWRGEKMSKWKKLFVNTAGQLGFPVHKPYKELSQKEKDQLWNGYEAVPGIYAFFSYLETKTYKIQNRVMLARYKGKTTCPLCNGSRLRKETSYVKCGGKNIQALIAMPIDALLAFFNQIELSDHDIKLSKRLLSEIRTRLAYLCEVGLGYLTLNRPSNTLSGGESQRIHLVSSLGSNLTGAMYILDEPSIGLHSRDNDRLIQILKKLRDLKNTVIVVEHDEAIMRAADQIIDIGPEAGSHGGKVVFQGSMDKLLKEADSLTAKYLKAELKVPENNTKKKLTDFIEIKEANKYNLKNINVRIPTKALTIVSGVSGSGKSTLVREVLYPSIKSIDSKGNAEPVNCKSIRIPKEAIQAIVYVDQNPIGKSTRSNPVTYMKAFDPVRELFANLPAAKQAGYKPSDFSFNVEGGRCEVCKGEGIITVEMQFMADVELICENCNGLRYKADLLEVTYKGKSIADILDMTVKDAIEFFEDSEKNKQAGQISKQLKPLSEVGLDYLRLGQASTHLSGGEAQRVKLATFLQKGQNADKTLFIFDEPSTGLHFHDIAKLLHAFNALVKLGHTVLVIEHHPDMIRFADWHLDLGPEGGDAGGSLVFEGHTTDFLKCKKSYTALSLVKDAKSTKKER